MLKTKVQTEYYDVFLTDIQMHVVEPRKPLPWHRVILKSLRNKKPGRFFTKDFSITNEENGIFTTSLRQPPIPEKLLQEIEKAEAAGKKIRFFLPKNGIPVYPGKDLMEFIKARSKARLTDIPKELK